MKFRNLYKTACFSIEMWQVYTHKNGALVDVCLKHLGMILLYVSPHLQLLFLDVWLSEVRGQNLSSCFQDNGFLTISFKKH